MRCTWPTAASACFCARLSGRVASLSRWQPTPTAPLRAASGVGGSARARRGQRASASGRLSDQPAAAPSVAAAPANGSCIPPAVAQAAARAGGHPQAPAAPPQAHATGSTAGTCRAARGQELRGADRCPCRRRRAPRHDNDVEALGLQVAHHLHNGGQAGQVKGAGLGADQGGGAHLDHLRRAVGRGARGSDRTAAAAACAGSTWGAPAAPGDAFAGLEHSPRWGGGSGRRRCSCCAAVRPA